MNARSAEIERLGKELATQHGHPVVHQVVAAPDAIVRWLLDNALIPVEWEEVPTELPQYHSKLTLKVWIAGKKLNYTAFIPEAHNHDAYRRAVKLNMRRRMAMEIIDLIDPIEEGS